MSDNSDKLEAHKAGFYIESDLEKMVSLRSDANEQPQPQPQPQPQAQPLPLSLAIRRGNPQPASLTMQLARLKNHRPRSLSVPALQSLNQSRSIGASLKQFGDDYYEARSPVRKTNLNQAARRRSSADFAVMVPESSWLGTIMKTIRRMSGADIEQPQQQPAPDAADD